MRWPYTSRASIRSIQFAYLVGLIVVPFLVYGTLLLVRLRSFATVLREHTIYETDLSPGYQAALKIALNTVPCCPQADWKPSVLEVSQESIPRIIHQTYKTNEIPAGDWTAAHELCLNVHRRADNWTHMFWTDATAREFVDTHYHAFLETYDAYPYNIQRVDAMRYFILYHYGGVYIDLDVGCARPMESLLKFPAFLPGTRPLGVSNDVMGSRRGHPLMRSLGEALLMQGPGKSYGTKYATVFFSTGPMFVNRILARYWRGAVRSGQDKVTILPPQFYDKTHASFFVHFPGSSWHGSDAHSVMALVHWGWLVVVILGLVYFYTLMSRRSRAIALAKLQAGKYISCD